MAFLPLLSIAFVLLAYTAAADSCVSKPCGSDYRVTSWNPVREGSYSVYYYEVVTDGCVGVVFTDVLVQMSLSCQNCATIHCYDSNWDVVSCKYTPKWVTSDSFFQSKGISVTSGLQWTLPSTTTSLRFSINVNPATTTSAQGKIYTKGNSWTSCSVITPVCNCNTCPPCPGSCYRPTYQTYPSCTCSNCTACVSGTYQVAPCNTTSNAVCLPCRQCLNSTTYETTSCTSTTNRVCNNCTQCVNNMTYQTRTCSGNQNRLCANCTQCVNGVNYESVPCNTTSNRVCLPCRTCIAGQYQTTNCTTTHNRICVNCTVCMDGFYRSAPCNATSDATCTHCTQCVTNMTYETVACNATRNRVCANCTTCVAGTYETVPCTGHNRICTNCTECVPGESVETVPCGPNNNRVCTNCTVCDAGFYRSAPCNSTTDTICQQCSNCSANEQVLYPCNATHDVVCVPCPECANCSAIPNSHLTNNGLNCSCNEGYSEQTTETGTVCALTPCCADCESCGFNRSVTCLNHDPDLCDYSCDYAPSCSEVGTNASSNGYTINYLGVSQDAACCSAGGGECTCFNYQVASSLANINLNTFIIGTTCSGTANQQCDPNGLIPPPCISDVLRDGVGGQQFFTTFVTNTPDPFTNIEGIYITNLGLVQDYANVTVVYQGHINASSLPITFSVADSEGRACLIASITGPDCVDCSTNPTAVQGVHKTLQGMEEIEDLSTDNNSGNANGNVMMAIVFTLMNIAMIGAVRQ